jgi:hypothetical protein
MCKRMVMFHCHNFSPSLIMVFKTETCRKRTCKLNNALSCHTVQGDSTVPNTVMVTK